MEQEQSQQPDLRIVDRPSRPWWSEGTTVIVQRPPKWRQPWTKEELHEVLSRPKEDFEALAKRLGRSPGSMNRMRNLLREVAGLVQDKTGFEPPNSKRAQLAREVLREAGIDKLDLLEKKERLPRGHGVRSDKTAKALRLEQGSIREKARELRKEVAKRTERSGG